MIKKFFAVAVAAAMLTGCGKPYSVESVENVETGDIVFINSFTNWAWGYQNYGIFIDNTGDIYKYDFSEFRGLTLKEELEKMTEIMQESDAETNAFDENDIKYMYSMLVDVDEEAGFKTEHLMCDYGQRSLYGVKYDENNEPDAVLIYSYGDNEKKPLDKNAQKIYDYYKRAIGR